MEIGSEFEWDSELREKKNKNIKFPEVEDDVLTFSGRTSIELILNNLQKAKMAMLPSYCCESILQPFRKAGIEICFYEVNYDGKLTINLDILDEANILFWCNYFGYNIEMPNIFEFKQRGGIVIEDITHSFFSEHSYHKQSDFLVASIRKWLPVLCGGYCARIKGKLKTKPTSYPSKNFLEEKKNAMLLKSAYLTDEDEKKKLIFMLSLIHIYKLK